MQARSPSQRLGALLGTTGSGIGVTRTPWAVGKWKEVEGVGPELPPLEIHG